MTLIKKYLLGIILCLVLPVSAFSVVITVTSDMSDADAINPIQAAGSGDIVELAFGIYQFRFSKCGLPKFFWQYGT